MRGATGAACKSCHTMIDFNPPPHAGGDDPAGASAASPLISIPASHAGGDSFSTSFTMSRMSFQSPPPHAGGDDVFMIHSEGDCVFQSPPPMREATRRVLRGHMVVAISIPASHAGGDSLSDLRECHRRYFNPRLPCGRRHCRALRSLQDRYFNPRLPCGRRRRRHLRIRVRSYFNPRLPCGRRPKLWRNPWSPFKFQSPPPMREATMCPRRVFEAATISIPASHAGGDYLLPYLYCILYKFQSPPPMREATISAALEALIDVISIPASHAGGDVSEIPECSLKPYFNPRLPCGRRPVEGLLNPPTPTNFNPRLPCGRRLLLN